MQRRPVGLVRLAFLLAMLAPVWLGPAMMPVIYALGGGPQHQCACGMKRGACGCLTCQELERQRKHDEASVPTIRTTCDTDGVAPSSPSQNAVSGAPEIARVASAPSHGTFATPDFQNPVARTREPPPTPPPRVTTV